MVDQIEGIQSQISIGKETVWGTAVDPTISIAVNPSDGINPKSEKKGVETIKGTPAKNKAFIKQKTTYEGGYELPMTPQVLGYLLMSAIGSPTTTTIETGVYKHIFSESIVKNSLTIEQVVGYGYVKRYSGYILDGFKISGKVDEPITFSFTGIAKKQSDAVKISPAYEIRRPFDWLDVSQFSINGSDLKNKISSFEFEYKNNLAPFHGFGSDEATQKYVGQSEFTGKIEMILDSTSKAYFDNLITNREESGSIVIELTGDLVGATEKDKFILSMYRFTFNSVETKLDTGYTAVTLEVVGAEHSTNGLIGAELHNGVSSY